MRPIVAVVLGLLVAPLPQSRAQAPAEFAALIARLSEPDGAFHSDNLVSNETSYLHVFSAFRDLGIKGGAYLGVGPEQSFSYLAEIEPEIAFIVDIRRDNLLLHLLLKAMFATAGNRLEYLCLLYGRAAPTDLALWTDLPLESLLEYLDARSADSVLHVANHRRLMAMVGSFGVPLTETDRATLRRFHDEFARAGLDVQYTTQAGRMWRAMPTNRDLYLATDLDGVQGSYLASEDRWRRVRDLQRRHRVIPVTGDLAGPKALRAIGQYLTETRRTVSVFYVSNVEQYLFRNDVFPAFVANTRTLPTGPNSLLVRSLVGGGRWSGGSGSSPGLVSRQRAQTFKRFREITATPDSVSYRALVADAFELRLRTGPPVDR